MKCEACQVTWSEYFPEGTGRVCWSCGTEIVKPPTKVRPQFVLPPDAQRAHAGERPT